MKTMFSSIKMIFFKKICCKKRQQPSEQKEENKSSQNQNLVSEVQSSVCFLNIEEKLSISQEKENERKYKFITLIQNFATTHSIILFALLGYIICSLIFPPLLFAFGLVILICVRLVKRTLIWIANCWNKDKQIKNQPTKETQDISDVKRETKGSLNCHEQQEVVVSKKQVKYYGIRNYELSCYINASLQLIWYIYNQDPSFLEKRESQLAQKLCSLFKQIESPIICYEKYINYLKSVSRKTHRVQNNRGGDAYLSLITFLQTICQEEKESNQTKEKKEDSSKTNNFLSYYQIKYEETQICQECFQCKDIDVNKFISKFSDCSLHTDSLQEFQELEKGDRYTSESSFCENCAKEFQLKRVITVFPQFLIVKFNKVVEKNQSIQQISEFIFYHNKNGIPVKYKLVGYCSHSSFHYTYTALYENWILFNDSFCDKTDINLQNALFLLLEKIEQ